MTQQQDEIHAAINQGLARHCRCFTEAIERHDLPSPVLNLPAMVFLKADQFIWIWTGFGDNSAPPRPGKLWLPTDDGFFRPEPAISFIRYAIYTEGCIFIFRKSHRPEFIEELCAPDLVEKLRAYVDDKVSSLFSLKEKLGR